MAATKIVFHHMVLIFHSFKDLEDFWAIRLRDDFETTSTKSSDGVFSQVLIRWFSSSTWICTLSESDFGRSMESLLGSLLKYNALEDFQEVFQTTSKKSSRRLQRNLPDDFQEVF
ncbi:hypothetical protein IGI04_019688 [Brassica rapa subsp. trilocularis]|uniref:Uncharacterized protein n=1 Tax=Brassica rapa subsp. trilocularis TaxID=1813537 RepID=A0ABQ7MJY6_BRACM|nr:hypothetical protein IGI04_019688 [Brassica rapa subsp. trilocularis]